MVRAVKASEAQVFGGRGKALPARPGQAVLAFDHEGNFHGDQLLVVSDQYSVGQYSVGQSSVLIH